MIKKIIYIIFLFPGLFSRIGYSKIGIAYISDVRQKWWWSYWFQVNLITNIQFSFSCLQKILFLFISENSWLCYMWCPMEVQKRISSRYGILLPKLFWPTVGKNCSRDREKVLNFKAEGREFSKFLRSLEQFIQTVNSQNNFW